MDAESGKKKFWLKNGVDENQFGQPGHVRGPVLKKTFHFRHWETG
jgi:hypothetical protein